MKKYQLRLPGNPARSLPGLLMITPETRARVINRGRTIVKNAVSNGRPAKILRLDFSLLAVFLTLLCGHLLSLSSSAQTTTSTIEGTVTDPNGAVIAGATVKVSAVTLATERTATTDAEGFYRITALPAGSYLLAVSGKGFAARSSNVELTLNRVAKFDVKLEVGGVGTEVTVTDELPLLETTASSSGATVTPKQIQELPVNGREYLDLLQLVPGVAINRQSTGDNANPVLGERSGNNNFFIDGQPNKDTVSGGAAAQFNQETIAEFQVLTTGFKAEFGQASGAVVNVITKSGGNGFHGVGSFFHRNEALDSVNSLDTTVTDPLHLRRFDYSIAIGGPIIRDKIFFFGSSERITEDRAIDFKYPNLGTSAGAATVLQLLHSQEDPLNVFNRERTTRNFFKIDEHFGRHQLVQELNYTNGYDRGFGAGLPSTRTSTGSRHLLLGFGDTLLLGDLANPWLVSLLGSYRGEPSDTQPTHPEFTGTTSLSGFSAVRPCPAGCSAANLFGDLPTITFGNATTLATLEQNYTSFSANADKRFGGHDIKFGWQFLRTKVDGLDSLTLTNQLFPTVNDFINFGPVNSGIFLLLRAGGPTPESRQIRLRNNYDGVYGQDDWKIGKNLTVNLGLRYDHDSEFSGQKNFSPRLGVAWAVTPKTVIRSNFGVFYDQFRLGLVEQIPGFGGSDRRVVQSLYFPRGYYGSPSFISSLARAVGLPGPCTSNVLTDAQITAGGVTCPTGGGPIVGVDRLNNVVAPGHAPIPANAVINISNIQALSGLSPSQYLTAAAAAIGQPNGYFEWGVFGVLNNPIIPSQTSPTSVDGTFRTPHTLGFSVGAQHELTKDIVVAADYYHREMRDLLGVRISNLAFKSRVAGIGRSFDAPNTTGEIRTFGPFFKGKYDALVFSLNKRLTHRYSLGANYTYANATDNSLGIFTNGTDQFIGIAPVVTEPCPTGVACTPQTNANAPFTSRNGNFVAKAGTFVNGPDLDKGPSSLALESIFQVNGLVELPYQFQVSGIFRAQSGFHFSRFDALNRDPDGNGNFNSIDFTAGRNAFSAPAFVNVDVRFSKRFTIGERVKVEALLEFFNLLNRQNPAAIQNRVDVLNQPFGSKTQVLPGREGQVGFRVSF